MGTYTPEGQMSKASLFDSGNKKGEGVSMPSPTCNGKYHPPIISSVRYLQSYFSRHL